MYNKILSGPFIKQFYQLIAYIFIALPSNMKTTTIKRSSKKKWLKYFESPLRKTIPCF